MARMAPKAEKRDQVSWESLHRTVSDSHYSNDWDPTHASPAVALYEAWLDLIPPFMQDNILDQLILPKVQRAVSSWKPNSSTGTSSLHAIVFPWLPHVGLRMEEFLGDARRKVRNMFKAVDISRGVPEDLMAWKQVSKTGMRGSTDRRFTISQ